MQLGHDSDPACRDVFGRERKSEVFLDALGVVLRGKTLPRERRSSRCCRRKRGPQVGIRFLNKGQLLAKATHELPPRFRLRIPARMAGRPVAGEDRRGETNSFRPRQIARSKMRGPQRITSCLVEGLRARSNGDRQPTPPTLPMTTTPYTSPSRIGDKRFRHRSVSPRSGRVTPHGSKR